MDFMESSVEMVRRRLRKVWKIWFWSAEDEETASLIDDSVTFKSVQVISETSEISASAKKKKTWRKKIQKIALDTCKFIGMGAETLSAPGLTPNPYFLSYSFNQRAFGGSACAYYSGEDYDYQMYSYNFSGQY